MFEARCAFQGAFLPSRGDANHLGWLFAYDGARRLTQQAKKASPTTDAPNNAIPNPGSLSGVPEQYQYAYDAAQNLLSRTRRDALVDTVTSLPADPSGRNRPSAIDGTALSYDANGNLTSKGDLRFEYDFRNRLTRVTNGLGAEIATYTYDAFNRRVGRQVGVELRETSWSGWQPVEETVGGLLHQRRTYGAGLDEIVELTTDLDGDGALESSLVPLYDASGNLAVVTDVNGKPVERYLYSPYGATKTLVDSTPPRVEQVRIVGGELWVELSEEVLGSVLLPSHGTGGVTLIETATLAGHGLSTTQPVTSGRQAWRRVVYTPAAPGPAAGTEVTLTLTASSLVDPFLNPAAADFELTFPWPAADAVLFDDTAPQVAQVLLQDGFLEVELTEEPDTATLGALLVDGTATNWTLQSDRYTLRTDTALADGAHQIVVGVALADLQGLTLAAEQNHSFNASASVPNAIVYREPDPRETSATTVANPFGFQGHPRDAETGLIYIRNRYYDPEMGRFTTADPLGYVDGPSMYLFAGYSPVNFGDPMGLETIVIAFGRGWESPSRKGDEGDQGRNFKLAAETLARDMRTYVDEENERRRGAGKKGQELLYIEGPVPVVNKFEFEQLVNKERSTGPIVEMHVFSHAWEGGLNFGGDSATDEPWTVRNFTTPRIKNLDKNAFDDDAMITLYGCKTAGTGLGGYLQRSFGTTKPFAESLAEGTGKVVTGFGCASHFEGTEQEGMYLVPDDPEQVRTFAP